MTILEVTFKDSTNTLVATLTSSDYTATGKMVNANVGTDKEVTATVTLQGKAADNYKLDSNMTTAKVAITQARGGVLQEENLKQKFSDRKQKTFTPDYTGLPAGRHGHTAFPRHKLRELQRWKRLRLIQPERSPTR